MGLGALAFCFMSFLAVKLLRNSRMRSVGRFGQGEQHGKLPGCFDRVRQMRRHVKEIILLQRVRLARQQEFAFTGNDLHHSVLCRCVFGKFLAFGKTKQHSAGIGGAQQCPAYDAVRRKLCFSFEREDFFPRRVNQRFLIHAVRLTRPDELRFDLRQNKIVCSRAVFVAC